jgi:hypothetical protein
MKKKPLTVVGIGYLMSIFIYGFAIRICERPLVRSIDPWYSEEFGGYPFYNAGDGEVSIEREK